MNLKHNIKHNIIQYKLSSEFIEQSVESLFYCIKKNGNTYTDTWKSIWNNIRRPVDNVTINFSDILQNNMANNGSLYFEFNRYYYPVSTPVKSSVLNSLLKTGL